MTSPPSERPLLERERELARLAGAWQEAAAGRGSVWLVRAEAGGGKTRLLRAATDGLPSRWGTAEPVLPPDPYLAVMQALPGFRPAPRRADSVARAVERLEQLAGGGPLVLVLDDLHFADEGTVAVLVRLATLAGSRPWLVLGALRPGEGTEALRLAVTELQSQGQAACLDLAPLSAAAIAGLIARTRGTPPASDEAERIHADSGGNPWFAEALARGAGAMAATRDRILFRLDRLDRAVPGARGLLAVLAAAGEPVPHPAVAALAGTDTAAVRQVLRGLRDAGVLRETGGAWSFRHELLRRSLLDDLLEAEQRDAHRRLAEALEAHAGPAILAMHYAEAHDPRAATWALQAADDAAAVEAHTEALAQAERALGFAQEPALRRAVLRRAADEAGALGRFQQSAGYAEAALSLPGAMPEETAYLHWMAARSIPGPRGLEHLDAAEAVLIGRQPGYVLARVAGNRARRLLDAGRPEEAAAQAHRVLDLAPLGGGDEPARAEFSARQVLAGVAALHGDPDWRAHIDALAAFAGRHDLPREFAVAAIVEGYQYAVASLYLTETDALYRRALEEMARAEIRWASLLEPYRVAELMLRGIYTGAREARAACPAPVPETGAVDVLHFAAVLLETRAGTLARARTLLDAWPPPPRLRGQALQTLATLELQQAEAAHGGGGMDAVAARARAAYATFSGQHFARAAGCAAVAIARAGAPPPGPPPWLHGEAPLRVLWDWAGGIAGNDRATLQTVAVRLAAIGCPYEAALALSDAGDLTAAFRDLRALGAAPAREQLARRLRAAGLPIPRGSALAGAAPLTDTERAVCRLVAAGSTNRAVAATLHIGLRTVEAYLSRIYEKTGQHGRAALAAWWTEQERGG